MPGATAVDTISATLRKLLRPFESHGFTTSVSPTFSMRTDRLDSHFWSKAPSRAMPQTIGERQFPPSIVRAWVTFELCRTVSISSPCDLFTSTGSDFVAQGIKPVSAALVDEV